MEAIEVAERPIFAGFRACREVAEFGIMFRWLNQRNESGDCGMRMRSPDSDRNRRCAESLAIPRRVLSRYNGAQKNTLRGVRSRAPGLVRPALSLGTRSCLRGAAYLSGSGGASRVLPRLRQGETRTAGLSGRQPDLHQALCLLRGPALSLRQRSRTSPRSCAFDWETVKELDKQYMRAQLVRMPVRAPQVIGIDEISIRKGHDYRIVVSDLDPTPRDLVWRPGPPEASMNQFFDWLGPERRSKRIRLVVMDMWKAFYNATKEAASQAAILYDKFHVMRHLGEVLDRVRKAEYARLKGRDRKFIKGQKYTLLSRRENLSLKGRQALKTLLAANKRLNTAYVLKESFGQLWGYEREGWARRFFDNWRASLKWQRLKPYEEFAEMIDRHWDGIAAYCKPENKVSLGFVEGFNNKIRVIQRRAYGLRDEEYLRLKVLTCMLPAL